MEQLSQKIAERVVQRLDDRKEIAEAYQEGMYVRAREEVNSCNKNSSKNADMRLIQLIRSAQDETSNFEAKAI